MAYDSGKAVLTALVADPVLTVFKFFAALLSHSASMMNGASHSLMDSIGLKVAEQPLNDDRSLNYKLLLNLPAGCSRLI